MRSPAIAATLGVCVLWIANVGSTRQPDSRVLFVEDFETGSVADLGKRWSDVSNQAGKVLAFSADVPPGSTGRRSLQMTATLGENTGGHLYRQLPRGVETVFARFYVKFAPDAEYTVPSSRTSTWIGWTSLLKRSSSQRTTEERSEKTTRSMSHSLTRQR